MPINKTISYPLIPTNMTNFDCPSIHQNLRIMGSYATGIRLLPCCVYSTDKNYSSLDEYNSSEEIIKLKTATEWPAGCGACQRQELAGQRSYRHDAKNYFQSGHEARVEIFPSNVCNIKCMMCNEIYSTALAQEKYAMGKISQDFVKEFEIVDECIDIVSKMDNVKSVSIIGGEFFLTKKNLNFLDFCIHQNIRVRVVTNATVILNQHFERLKQIKDLELQISIDGHERSYEFMRYPATWDQFSEKSKKLIKELPTADINFHYVVQPLNIQNIVPTLDWINRLRTPVSVTNLVNPEYLSWSILKSQEKDSIINLLNSQTANKEYRLTRQQQEFMRTICETIKNSQYKLQHRNRFIETFTETMNQRKITLDRVQEHLGLLESITRI